MPPNPCGGSSRNSLYKYIQLLYTLLPHEHEVRSGDLVDIEQFDRVLDGAMGDDGN